MSPSWIDHLAPPAGAALAAAACLFVAAVAPPWGPARGEAPRIVALGGSVAEAVVSLGHGASLVGVDASGGAVPGLDPALPRLGYHKQLSAEGLLSLGPTFVIGAADSGPPAALDQVRAAGVPVALVEESATVEGAARRLEEVGAALGMDATAAADRLRAEAVAASQRARQGRAPRVLFLYARGGGHLVVAGTDTAADAIITLAGGVNAVQGYPGYRPLTPEAAVAAAPEVVLVTDNGLASLGGAAGLWTQPGLALTPAGQAGRLVAVEDLLLLGFGPRLPLAIETLGQALDQIAGAQP